MRKVVTIFALCGAAGGLLVPPAHASADTIGGARLAGRGYVWDKSSGVPEPPHIVASSYVIADLETGRVLAAKDPHGHYRPASTLKTLTSITLIPRLDPHKKVKPSLNAVNASGSAVGLSTKMDYTVNDLFHGLLMQSGNDAAIALAEANGGLPRTLDAMNAEARRIQARDTVARTPNGLDDDPPLTLHQQHSSAYDMALIMKQGLTLPDFRKYVGAKLYQWPAPPTKEELKKGKKTGGYEIGTHDHLLLGDSYPGMIGGKNGWTSHALGSFVGAATRHGHTIIIALMHAQSDFWPDARELLNWGFAERDKAEPVGTLVEPIPPPARPKTKPKVMARKPGAGAGAQTSPFDGLGWWKVGLPAGAAVAIIAGLAVGLRRRRRPAAEGPPPRGPLALPPGPSPAYDAGDTAWQDSGIEADEPPPPPRRRPPGDVKVAGSPLTSGEPSRPPSWETVPNPTQETAPEPDTTSDDGRAWTVRLPETAEPRSEPAEEETAGTTAGTTAGNGRGPFEPFDQADEDSGRDEPRGTSTNGGSTNGDATNGTSANGDSTNGDSANGDSTNGDSANGDSANGDDPRRDEAHGDETQRS
jgi:D-alanyl-D-alanine carboxypeptidase (penicillin-binding protein 5/6)